MRHKTILTLLIILICFITSAHAARVWVEPAYLEISEGANFTVDIMVDPEGDDEVMGAEYKLYFNTTLLNATDQVQGPFLGGNPIGIPDPINNTIGRVWYGEYRIGDVGVTDPGVLASISFQVIGERGVCDLDLTDVMLSNTSAAEIPANVSNGCAEILSGIIGDVDCQNGVTMGDAIQVAMSTIYGTELYPLADPWAADVDCQNGVTMGDAIQIAMSTIYGTDLYPLEGC
ncbi:MAG: cohesin domain-containing protein [Euryarchaeota archaeon]|nr:cohesin domain-containing protein [Euryarchaeota archaeon]